MLRRMQILFRGSNEAELKATVNKWVLRCFQTFSTVCPSQFR